MKAKTGETRAGTDTPRGVAVEARRGNTVAPDHLQPPLGLSLGGVACVLLVVLVWLKRRSRRRSSTKPYRAAASGWLSVGRIEWVAVPSLQAPAFHHDHPKSDNALSFGHLTRGLVARHPEDADPGRQALAEVRVLEKRLPHCVVFVFARGPRNARG